jgi:hypothetical protein
MQFTARKTMAADSRLWRSVTLTGGICSLLFVGFVMYPTSSGNLKASPLEKLHERHAGKRSPCECNGDRYGDDFEGSWYWLRSPEQEKRVVINLYNRYCIRCHGVDGRGVWDIPDVPDLTNARWQATRTDGQLTRSILEGRGAVMPPFRGTLTLEESWAMARHLRSFIPGTEMSKPDTSKPDTGKPEPIEPKKLDAPPTHH